MQCLVCGFNSQSEPGVYNVNPYSAAAGAQRGYTSPCADYPSRSHFSPTMLSGGWGAQIGSSREYGGHSSHGAGAFLTRLRTDVPSIEKLAYLGLYVLNAVLLVLSIRATVLATGSLSGTTEAEFGDALIGGSVVGVILGFLILRSVLFSDDTQLKMGCSVLCLLAIVYWLWVISVNLSGGVLAVDPWTAVGATVPTAFGACLAIAMQTWLITILVRDARSLQAGKSTPTRAAL